MAKQLGLSASSLNVFKNCPRCFWLEKNRKIKQPDGIKASLPKGMDEMMKNYVNQHVALGNDVPWLDGLKATPFKDRARIKTFMSWQTFQRILLIDGQAVKVWGQVDDVIEYEDGSVSAWDYKTKATEPDISYGEKYYQGQLDMYHLLLDGQSLKVRTIGILTYGWPVEINSDGSMLWGWKNLTLNTDPDRAVAVATAAVRCLSAPEPESSADCQFCIYAEARR